jgi:hypothetical protein
MSDKQHAHITWQHKWLLMSQNMRPELCRIAREVMDSPCHECEMVLQFNPRYMHGHLAAGEFYNHLVEHHGLSHAEISNREQVPQTKITDQVRVWRLLHEEQKERLAKGELTWRDACRMAH